MIQCSASIVVIMDNHFNPSVSTQCLARAHRLGQRKPVYCFRLAMENTMEEKIYNRSVTKEGVALQVLDGKFSEMLFKAEEMENLTKSDTIVTCDKKGCGKKRRLMNQDPPPEDDEWFCCMNKDTRFNGCKIPMEPNLEKTRRGPMPIRNNPILEYLVGVVHKKTRRTALVLDYLPVKISHAEDLCCREAINKLKDEILGNCKPKSFGNTDTKSNKAYIPNAKLAFPNENGTSSVVKHSKDVDSSKANIGRAECATSVMETKPNDFDTGKTSIGRVDHATSKALGVASTFTRNNEPVKKIDCLTKTKTKPLTVDQKLGIEERSSTNTAGLNVKNVDRIEGNPGAKPAIDVDIISISSSEDEI